MGEVVKELTVDYVQKVLGVELYDYQKEFIEKWIEARKSDKKMRVVIRPKRGGDPILRQIAYLMLLLERYD